MITNYIVHMLWKSLTATMLISVWCFLQEGYWAHDISFGSVDGVLEYYWCPPGYCQCSNNNECNSVYYYDDNDLQCVCDRQGEVTRYAR